MPFAIGIAGAIAGAAIAGAAAAGAISATLAIVLTIAVTAVTAIAQRLLTKKPKSNPLSFEDRTTTIRQPISPWPVWYGEGRKGGVIVGPRTFKIGTSIWLVVVWAGHPVQSLQDVFLNDSQIEVHADGSVDGTFDGAAIDGKLFVYHHLGDENQTVDLNLKAVLPLEWTDQHRGRGLAYSVFEFVNQPANFPTGVPQISIYGQGHSRIYDPRTGLYGYSQNPVLCTRDQLCSTVYGYGVPFGDVDDAGLIPEANYCDDELEIGRGVNEFISIREYNSATSTNTTTDFITWSAPLYIFTGDEVRMSPDAGGVMPAGLTANTSYWARRNSLSNTLLAFYNSKADALADVNRIDITTTGTQPVRIWRRDAPFRLAGPEAALTGVDTAQDEIDGVNTRIRVTGGNRWRMASTSTIPGGLVGGAPYFANIGIGNGIQACLYPFGPAVNITGTGAGTRTVRVDGTGQLIDAVDLTTGVVTFPTGVDWPTGTEVMVRLNGGTAEPLTEGQRCYIINEDRGSFSPVYRLAASRRDADRGHHIVFTAAVTGDPYLESEFYGQKECRGLLTGDKVRLGLDVFGLGGIDYFWIRKSQDSGYLASSYENAIAGVRLLFDTEPQLFSDGPTVPPEVVTLRLLSRRRFSCVGLYDAEQDMDQVQAGLISSCGGAVLEPVLAGQWRIKAGRYRVPIFELDETSILEGTSLVVQSLPSAADSANAIRGVYTSPSNDDQPDDIPEYGDPLFLAEDGGEKISKDILLPFTNTPDAALRLAKMELMRSRFGRSISLTVPYGTVPGIEPTDTFDFTFAPLQYSRRPFEVTGLEAAFISGPGGVPLPRLIITARETSPEVYL